jgi:nanoRNase/pAp phosphatase (c-di-AMP/oligoRNAs hydrolase)
LRTRKPAVDVAKLAKFFGGGGHVKAAGFPVSGSFMERKGGVKII